MTRGEGITTVPHDVAAVAERNRLEDLVRDHYKGAVAAVFLDKDRTVIDPSNNNQPTIPGFPDAVAKLQAHGILVGWDTDSSDKDIRDIQAKTGTAGLSVREGGAGITLPNGEELNFVRSGDFFMKLLDQFEGNIYKDPDHRRRVIVLNGDPWPLIDSDTHFPGSRDRIVFLNRGRTATASAVFRGLDQSQGGRIVKATPFYEQMIGLMRGTKDSMLREQPFPDPEGIHEDTNPTAIRDEVAIFTSLAATKSKAMRELARILGIPVFHIGDGPKDNTSDVPEITTMAVGNAAPEFKSTPGVIVSEQPITAGAIDLMVNNILPRFAKPA